MSKRILCFGDSNTWGYDPYNQSEEASYHVRFESEVRWPGVLQKLLGRDYHIIEEGLNSRTTIFDDPFKKHRTGIRCLPACLETHEPIDLVVIMLGTNDLKPRVMGRVFDIAEGVGELVDVVRESGCGRYGKPPKVLLIAPMALSKEVENAPFAEQFSRESVEQSLLFPKYYAKIAKKKDCAFLNAADYAQAMGDGVHLDAQNHASLAEAVGKKVKEIFFDFK